MDDLPDPPRRRRLADLALTWGLPLLLLVGFRSAIAVSTGCDGDLAFGWRRIE